MARDDRGTASLELVGLLPVVVITMGLLLQGGAALYAVQGTSDAVRQAARAYSLGLDVDQAAADALPGGLRVKAVQAYGPDHTVRLTVSIPRLVAVGPATVTRVAVLP